MARTEINDLPGASLQVAAEAVDARVSNWVRDGEPSNALAQFVHAVSTVSPQLSRYAINANQEQTQADAAKALDAIDKAEQESRTKAVALVKSGDIPFGANPYVKQYARRSFFRRLAGQIGQEVAAEYQQSPVQNSSGGEVDSWARKRFSEKAKELGIEDGADVDYLEGFAPSKEHAVSALVAQHTHQVIAKNEQDFKDALQQQVGDTAETRLTAGDGNPDAAAASIGNMVLNDAVGNGMPPRKAYELTLDGMISKAVASGDTRFLDIAGKIPTRDADGNVMPLADRAWAAERLTKARFALDAHLREKASADRMAQVHQQKQNENAMQGKLSKMLVTSGPDQFDKNFAPILAEAQGMVDAGGLPGDAAIKLQSMARDYRKAQVEDAATGFASVYESDKAQVLLAKINNRQITTLEEVFEAFKDPSIRPYQADALKAFAAATDQTNDEWKKIAAGQLKVFMEANQEAFKFSPIAATQFSNMVIAELNLYRTANPNAPLSSANPKDGAMMDMIPKIMQANFERIAAPKATTNPGTVDTVGGAVDASTVTTTGGDLSRIDKLVPLSELVRTDFTKAEDRQKAYEQYVTTMRETVPSVVRSLEQLPAVDYKRNDSVWNGTVMNESHASIQAKAEHAATQGNALLTLATKTGNQERILSAKAINGIISGYYRNLQEFDYRSGGSTVSRRGGLGGSLLPPSMPMDDYNVLHKAGLLKYQQSYLMGGSGQYVITDANKAIALLSKRLGDSLMPEALPAKTKE